jgi:TolB protein
MRQSALIALAIMVIGYGYSFAEKVYLKSYVSRSDSIPIGIIAFTSSNGSVLGSNNPSLVIGNDLDFCGRFQVFRYTRYDSAALINDKAGMYIDGDYSVDGEKVTMDCYLRSSFDTAVIAGKKFQGDLKLVRNMEHRYCNEIVEMLCGDKGIFETRMLFVKNEGAKKSIGVMDFDGFNQRMLTKDSIINVFPAWEDSARFLWVSYLRGKPDIYRGSVADGTYTIFIHSRYVQSSPDVSPTDGTVAYASSVAGNMNIYTCSPDGSTIKRLTMNGAVNTSPNWSPNGYRIAFTSDRSGSPSIYCMDVDGANQHNVTFGGHYEDSPAWSPKGDWIGYCEMGKNSKLDVWVVSPDGADAKQVTTMIGNNEWPSWSPDGQLIAYVNSNAGRSDIFVVRPDGSNVRRVTNAGNIKMPAWSGLGLQPGKPGWSEP